MQAEEILAKNIVAEYFCTTLIGTTVQWIGYALASGDWASRKAFTHANGIPARAVSATF